jgi:hypothetical protein
VAAELACSPDIVLPEGVAAIDDGVSLFQKAGKLLDGCLSNVTGRQHDPDNPRCLQLCDKIFQALGSRSALACQIFDGFRIMVIYNGRVSGSHEAADNVAAHPTKANHSQLHSQSPVSTGAAPILLRPVKYATMPKIKQI